MLNTPGKNPPPKIAGYSSHMPTPDEMVVMSQPLVKAVTKLAESLTGRVSAKWALGGEAGMLMAGVNVKADRLAINTSKEGCDEIWKELKEYQTLAPNVAEKKLARSADVGGQSLPVYIKSRYAEVTIDGVKVEIYGDEQIKVGEWDWGDPLDFTPYVISISGGKMPTVPLSLQSELALGLGWLDTVQLIADAVFAKHHHAPGLKIE